MFAFIFSDVGVGEWFVLLAIVLIVVGPTRLPSAARELGRWYARIRRAADEFKRQLMDMDTEVDQALNKTESEIEGAFKIEGDESKAIPVERDWNEGVPR